MFVSPTILLDCLCHSFMQLPFLEVLELKPPAKPLPPSRFNPSAEVVVLSGIFDIELEFVPYDDSEALTQAEILARPRFEPTSGFSPYGPAPHRRWSMVRSTRPRGLN